MRDREADIAVILDELIAGESLKAICRRDDMPGFATVMRWLAEDSESGRSFRDRYARAREAQAEAMADEILSIADEECTTVRADKHGSRDDDGDGNTVVVFDSAAVQRNRLRVDARKWLLSKLIPKKYGDKLELAGDKAAPFVVNITKFSDAKKQKDDE